ncbi:MAG: precorrin-6y C5,15-methyltransferase (decarboxylating) subunit CbiE [Vallitalea sp.]|jgi:cobalt-precorrin-7 (C5)-methyltransferase|nr:precorrin-6y C5,15-methyltransferase (decarboxylating) subunit CbiE [Vallitalea sp.]
MNRVNVVGVGPGHKDYILPIAYKVIEQSDILVGGRRNLDVFKYLNKKEFEYKSNLKDICIFINENKKDKKISVIVSGDTGFYSLLDFLQNNIGKESINVIPGISSYQYLFSKINKSYKDYKLFSLHGRDVNWIEELVEGKGVFLLTDREHSPNKIAEQLIRANIENVTIVVGENLSYENEKISIDTPRNIINKTYSSLSVVVIEKNGK